jgi:hypothetical protein
MEKSPYFLKKHLILSIRSFIPKNGVNLFTASQQFDALWAIFAWQSLKI